MIADNTLCILESLSEDSKASDERSNVWNIGWSDEPIGSEACSSDVVSTEVGEVVTLDEEDMENDKKVVELLEKNAVLQNDHDKSVAELADANKDKEELQAKNVELEAKLEETLALVKELEDSTAEKAEAFDKLEAEKAELTTKLEETSVELAEIEEARKLDARKNVLSDLGMSEERVIKTLAKTADLDDEAFDAEVLDLKAFMTEFTPIPSILEETPEPKAVEETVEEVEEVVAEEVEEEEEASEEEITEVLEEIEEEETPVAEAVGAISVEETEETDMSVTMAKALGVNPESL